MKLIFGNIVINIINDSINIYYFISHRRRQVLKKLQCYTLKQLRCYFNCFDNLTKILQNNRTKVSHCEGNILYFWTFIDFGNFFFHFSVVTVFCFPCTKAMYTLQVITYIDVQVFVCIRSEPLYTKTRTVFYTDYNFVVV